MGGFVYIRKIAGEDAEAFGKRCRKATYPMERCGLPEKAVISRGEYQIHVYDKMRVPSENVLELDNGDFVIGTGALFYRKQMGVAALKRLYAEFGSDQFSFENFYGHFAVWILKNDELALFNDYRGMYHVYHDRDMNVVSSAFLPVCHTVPTRTPRYQEIYEYLTYGMLLDHKTVIEEVDVLDRRQVVKPLDRESSYAKPLHVRKFDGSRPMSDQVEEVHHALEDYFGTVTRHFGDQQSIGLSGGYDSRMTLAYMKNSGADPLVYTHGDEDSMDVKIAKMIAAGEGFALQYSENKAKPEFPASALPDRVANAYYYLDGIPWTGLFDPWAMTVDARRATERQDLVRLYGMAGEIYRRSRHLANRSYHISQYLQIQFDAADYSAYGNHFNKRQFLDGCGAKLLRTLDIDGEVMQRIDCEMAYPHHTLPSMSGPQMSNQNQRAFALTPYAEPVLTLPSREISMQFRYLGLFQGELIKRVSPSLAAYPSEYGYSFSEGPGMKARIREFAKLAMPKSVRPFLRRRKSRLSWPKELPFFQSDAYIRQLFPDGYPHTGQIVSLDGVRNPVVYSNALTLEILLSGRFCHEPG
jgi:asparagine synthase (glutamine-hydrolysing)